MAKYKLIPLREELRLVDEVFTYSVKESIRLRTTASELCMVVLLQTFVLSYNNKSFVISTGTVLYYDTERHSGPLSLG
jgi:hypothetical protein